MQLLVLITLPARTLKDCGNVGEVSADVVQLSRRSVYQGALFRPSVDLATNKFECFTTPYNDAKATLFLS